MTPLWLLTAVALAAPERPAPCAAEDRPRYTIAATVNPDARLVRVHQQVVVTNDSDADWADVRLRLPEPPARLTAAQISATAARRPVQVQQDDSALVVPVPVPAQSSLELSLTFALALPSLHVPLPEPVGFGRTGGWILLADWLPLVVPHDGTRWVVHPSIDRGDHANFPKADVDLVLTAPAPWRVQATGAVTSEGTTHTVRARGVKELAVTLCQGCTTDTVVAGPTTLRVTALVPRPTTRDHAADALRWMTHRFGPLTDPELDVILLPCAHFGIEFPGLILQCGDPDPERAADHAFVVGHEVAHQWFYNEIPNDQFADPWVDEALASWASLAWLHDDHPTLETATWTVLEDALRHDAGRATGPVSAYTEATYNPRVYYRGATFWARLQRQWPTAFDAGLRAHLAQDRCTDATSRTLLDRILAHEDADRDAIEALYRRWIDPGR